MHVGLALPQYDYSVAGEVPLTWPTVAAYATAADRLGFASVWLADHLTMTVERAGGPPGEHHGFDPLVTLAAVSRITTTAKIGTLVLCCQLRPAAVLAKMAAGVDVLSGGRLIAGMGAGWHPPDYIAAGVPFQRPGERLRELAAAITAAKAMWRGEDGAPPCLPPPVQPGGPPVWVGGRGDRLLDVVARHADGWNMVWAVTPDAYRDRVAVLDQACEQAGRDPASITRSLGLYTLVGENESDLRARFEDMRNRTPAGVLDGVSLDDWRQGRLVGTVEQVGEQVAAWAALGVSHLILGLGAVPFQGTTTDDLELVASATS